MHVCVCVRLHTCMCSCGCGSCRRLTSCLLGLHSLACALVNSSQRPMLSPLSSHFPFSSVFLLGVTLGTTGLGLLPPPHSLVSVPLTTSAPHGSVSTTASSQPPSVSWSLGTVMTSLLTPSGGRMAEPLGQSGGGASISGSLMGFSLSPATEPFPAKLVERIRAGQFVEMRDLLTDNISLLQHLETLGGNHPTLLSTPGALRPRLREVSTLPVWMYCFLAYVAIRSTDPVVRDMLTYARLLIRESQRHGGNGWVDYDRVFRQQATLDPSLQWNTLHPGIQAAMLVGSSSGRGLFCTLCRETDHTAERCALSYLQGPLPQRPPTISPSPHARPGYQPPRRRPESLSRICVSWNRGSCTYPGACNFRHVCAICRQRHMARDCTDAPEDSPYRMVAGKQGPRAKPGGRL